MVVAKNPGVGRGRGGGRPKGKTRDVELLQLRMSPHAADLIRAAAEAGKVPAWRVVELAILATHDGTREPSADVPAAPPPALPPEAQEVAQECAAFLDAHVNRPAALAALRRAWKQALALAAHELKARTGVEPTKG